MITEALIFTVYTTGVPDLQTTPGALPGAALGPAVLPAWLTYAQGHFQTKCPQETTSMVEILDPCYTREDIEAGRCLVWRKGESEV